LWLPLLWLTLLWLTLLWLTLLWLTIHRLATHRVAALWFSSLRVSGLAFTGIVHRQLIGIRIPRLFGFVRESPLLGGQFTSPLSQLLNPLFGSLPALRLSILRIAAILRFAPLRLTGLRLAWLRLPIHRLASLWLTRLRLATLRLAFLRLPVHWFTALWFAGLRFSGLWLSRLGIVHRQFFPGLLSQGLSLTFGLTGELLQGLRRLRLGFHRSLSVVLPHRLVRSFGGILSFRPCHRSSPLRQLANRTGQFLLRTALLLHRLLQPLGILGILSDCLIGLLLQFRLLRSQILRLLGQGIQLRNPRFAGSHFVLLILLSGISHLRLSLSWIELLSQRLQSLCGVRLLLGRLLHRFLQLRCRRCRFIRVRRRCGLLLGELFHLLLSLGRFGQSLLRSLLLGLGLGSAPQLS